MELCSLERKVKISKILKIYLISLVMILFMIIFSVIYAFLTFKKVPNASILVSINKQKASGYLISSVQYVSSSGLSGFNEIQKRSKQMPGAGNLYVVSREEQAGTY